MHTTDSPWQLARRAQSMNPSAIRAILKVTERAGTLNFTGGLPPPETFPPEAMRQGAQVTPDQLLISSARLQGAALVAKIPIDEGAPFHVRAPGCDTLRLSFVTATPEQTGRGIAALGQVLRQAPEPK